MIMEYPVVDLCDDDLVYPQEHGKEDQYDSDHDQRDPQSRYISALKHRQVSAKHRRDRQRDHNASEYRTRSVDRKVIFIVFHVYRLMQLAVDNYIISQVFQKRNILLMILTVKDNCQAFF